MQLNFEWDPRKAVINKEKHRVTFEEASSVFLDPIAITIYDEDHSMEEERWITMGLSTKNSLLAVCHTYKEQGRNSATIR
ncbi:MAG: BrnT family toxin [Deltaproteobacteria bacterium]|nr:BrnT family toxin [Deltaproteobacteria bacterium]